MKAFQISDIKLFMKNLLILETFDAFRVSEFSVTTSVTYTIDGALHPEFYDEETRNTLLDSETYTSWQSIKTFCLSIIKGKQTPLNFKIVFLLSQENLSQLLADNHIAMNTDDIFGLYLNCQYENQSLMCVTGTSLRLFSLDKTLDNVWDSSVITFLKKHELPYEEVQCIDVGTDALTSKEKEEKAPKEKT